MENLESVMRRIKKLLAIAEDSRGDPNECAAAARMAESIMRKFQIEHAEVISVELQHEDVLSSVDIGATMDMDRRAKEASGWAGILAVPVAELFDAQARHAYTPDRGKTIRFSGYKTDVQMCRFTYEFIVSSMVVASRAYLKVYAVRRREAESFRRGYINACCASLKALKREKDAELQQASSSRAMVLSKGNAVAAHFGVVNYRTKMVRTSSAQSLQGGVYWTGTVLETLPNSYAWIFWNYGGFQSENAMANGNFAWAVRPGDVTAVPEPEVYALLLGGLGLLGVVAKRLRRSFGAS